MGFMERPIDPKKVAELTEQEKWECTVRWLNVLYRGHHYLSDGQMNVEEFLEDVNTICSPGCPYYEKCPSTAHDPYRPTMPVPMNFKVLERFTGKSSVSGVILPPKDSRYMYNVPRSE